jgi:hypothetical protein
VSVDTVNVESFGTSASNPSLFRNNGPDDGSGNDAEMDEMTSAHLRRARVLHQTNTMKLAIADVSDSA